MSLITAETAHASVVFFQDMEALHAKSPEITHWLVDRIMVDFGMCGEVVIVDRTTGQPHFDYEARSVWEAVANFLERQVVAGRDWPAAACWEHQTT